MTDPDYDLPFPRMESATDPHIGCTIIAKSQLVTGKRNGVTIELANDDPDGLPSYDRAFRFTIRRDHALEGQTAYQRVTLRQAWQIAGFLLVNTVRAKAIRAKGNIRQRLGIGSRPAEP